VDKNYLSSILPSKGYADDLYALGLPSYDISQQVYNDSDNARRQLPLLRLPMVKIWGYAGKWVFTFLLPPNSVCSEV